MAAIPDQPLSGPTPSCLGCEGRGRAPWVYEGNHQVTERFTGRLLLRGEVDFEAARVSRVFNHRRPDRTPAAILVAAHEQDIVEGVRLAGERGWQIAVRAGGHSWAAWSLREDSLLIDLGLLRDIEYHDETGIVEVSPAVTGGEELDPFLAARGRFFAGGHCPTVGLGGFLLQGGQGWNARGWAWGAENIVAVDVVTADGGLVRADATQNSDLYWAARGSGPGFFGVVTRFYLQTRKRFGMLARTVYAYDTDDFDEVMHWMYGVHGTVHPDVEIVCVTAQPPLPLPGHAGGPVLLVTALAFVDSLDQAQSMLAPFDTCPIADRALFAEIAAPTELSTLRTEQVLANPEGHRYVCDNVWLTGGGTTDVPAMRSTFVDLPTPKSFTIWFSMAPLRTLPDMALSFQSEVYLASYVVYDDEAQDEAARAWLSEHMAELQPATVGQFLADSDLATRQLKFMGNEQWQRLAAIRAVRDPNNRFVGYWTGDQPVQNANHWQ